MVEVGGSSAMKDMGRVQGWLRTNVEYIDMSYSMHTVRYIYIIY